MNFKSVLVTIICNSLFIFCNGQIPNNTKSTISQGKVEMIGIWKLFSKCEDYSYSFDSRVFMYDGKHVTLMLFHMIM